MEVLRPVVGNDAHAERALEMAGARTKGQPCLSVLGYRDREALEEARTPKEGSAPPHSPLHIRVDMVYQPGILPPPDIVLQPSPIFKIKTACSLVHLLL